MSPASKKKRHLLTGVFYFNKLKIIFKGGKIMKSTIFRNLEYKNKKLIIEFINGRVFIFKNVSKQEYLEIKDGITDENLNNFLLLHGGIEKSTL